MTCHDDEHSFIFCGAFLGRYRMHTIWNRTWAVQLSYLTLDVHGRRIEFMGHNTFKEEGNKYSLNSAWHDSSCVCVGVYIYSLRQEELIPDLNNFCVYLLYPFFIIIILFWQARKHWHGNVHQDKVLFSRFSYYSYEYDNYIIIIVFELATVSVYTYLKYIVKLHLHIYQSQNGLLVLLQFLFISVYVCCFHLLANFWCIIDKTTFVLSVRTVYRHYWFH